MTYVGLAAFSILGVFCRYTVDQLFPISSPQTFPWHTFAINVAGSFLIGCIFVVASEKNLLNESWRLVVTTGFLGSFTTFSAFSIQNFLLIQDGRIGLAAVYSLGSIIAGIGATFVGIILCRTFL